MKHLNGNILAVVDVETTSPDPEFGEIIEVCVLPLNHHAEPNKKITPFSMDICPVNRDNIDMDAIRVQRADYFHEREKCVYDKARILQALTTGVDADRAADYLVEWFDRLKLPNHKRIMPIAHNWCFDRDFLIKWLGRKTFDLIFDPRYRDTMCNTLYENDVACWQERDYPYQKNNLQYVCTTLRIERERSHRALDDCIATAEVYRKMLQHTI